MDNAVYNNVKEDEEIIVKPTQSIRDGNWVQDGNKGIFLGLPNIFNSSSYIKKQIILTSFESLDGWSKVGSLSVNIGTLLMQTSAIINTDAYIQSNVAGTENKINYLLKNPEFSCGLSFGHSTNQTIYFGMGDLTPYNTQQGLGFKNLNGTIYALSMNSGVESLTEITGLSLFNVYRVILDSKTKTAFYYVNGLLKATHTTNIPTSDDSTTMTFFITNTAAENKYIVPTFAMFQQDR